MAQPNSWITDIGEAYLSGGWDMATRDKHRQAYGLYAKHVRRFEKEIPVPVIYQDADPYNDYQDMRKTVVAEGKLRVFTGGDTPTFLTAQENYKSRAVHDWYGHLANDVDFTPEGEFSKWYAMADWYPPAICQLLFGEVVAQVAAIHVTGGFDYQQRPCLAPPEWIEQVCSCYDKPIPQGTYIW